eukprot:GHVU01093108.1.p2 GENE.GHVU01093108.1~~GHVU01093108.1.p2  ORF type:complete len:117 (-),score=15.88 GHVU01093108.1:168-518(-)
MDGWNESMNWCAQAIPIIEKIMKETRRPGVKEYINRYLLLREQASEARDWPPRPCRSRRRVGSPSGAASVDRCDGGSRSHEERKRVKGGRKNGGAEGCENFEARPIDVSCLSHCGG